MICTRQEMLIVSSHQVRRDMPRMYIMYLKLSVLLGNLLCKLKHKCIAFILLHANRRSTDYVARQRCTIGNIRVTTIRWTVSVASKWMRQNINKLYWIKSSPFIMNSWLNLYQKLHIIILPCSYILCSQLVIRHLKCVFTTILPIQYLVCREIAN